MYTKGILRVYYMYTIYEMDTLTWKFPGDSISEIMGKWMNSNTDQIEGNDKKLSKFYFLELL